MFLSQVILDRHNRHAMKMIADVYHLHQGIMAGFKHHADVARVLFRVEPEVGSREVKVLVQSQALPVWQGRLPGLLDERTKELNPQFFEGANLRFRLRANPVASRDGKRRGLVRDDALISWLKARESRMGVCFNDILAVDEGYLYGSKGDDQRSHKVRIKSARFEGRLQVVDPTTFGETVRFGIGPAKAFGCGLLSLARG